MQFVNITLPKTKEEVLEYLSDDESINQNVKFDEKHGKPKMRLQEKGGRVKITCEMLGGATKDNGFLIGTFFSGKLKEQDGKTRLSGVILTAPFYHLGLILLLGFFVYQCIKNAGFTPIPILAVGMSLMLFKDEFKKQGYIKRYLLRAERKAYQGAGHNDSCD